jgi:hypothetical protein
MTALDRKVSTELDEREEEIMDREAYRKLVKEVHPAGIYYCRKSDVWTHLIKGRVVTSQ